MTARPELRGDMGPACHDRVLGQSAPAPRGDRRGDGAESIAERARADARAAAAYFAAFAAEFARKVGPALERGGILLDHAAVPAAAMLMAREGWRRRRPLPSDGMEPTPPPP